MTHHLDIHASTILAAYGQAAAELLGSAVVLTDGKAGTVDELWLDELHGLRISIRGHFGKWPVSAVKFMAAPSASVGVADYDDRNSESKSGPA